MRRLVIGNMLWNAAFVAMAASEMIGVTSIHESLPWWFKWWWVCALAGGNLLIHVTMLRELRTQARRGR